MFGEFTDSVLTRLAARGRSGLHGEVLPARSVDTAVGRVRVYDWGSAKPCVVFVPDAPNVIEHYEYLAGLLSKSLRVVCFDMPGFGFSFPRPSYGHSLDVSVFDALPLAGGMMRVGIPPHRLPGELLDWEIQQIVDEGVELRLNTWVDDIPGLLEKEYQAVLMATGAHQAKKLAIRNANHPDNWLSLDLLRKACLGEKIDLTGKKVVVIGGGNVALDTARTVLRLGADEVRMAFLESRGEMPGLQWEVKVAEEEGIQMFASRTFKEIMVKDDKIVGVRCIEVIFRGFKRGRPDISEIPGSEHILPADIVIGGIGQSPDFSFLPQDGSLNTRFPVGIAGL